MLLNIIDTAFVVDTIGMLGFALAGILAARGRVVDPVGVFVLAFTTAFGGGLIRDVIIDSRPFYWVAHDEYVWGILILTVFAPRIVSKLQDETAHKLYLWADAVGLGSFCAAGTLMADKAGFPALPAVLVGVCTGVFGGLLRDVFLDRMPSVLSDRKPYAIVGFAGGWLLLGLEALGLDPSASTAIATLFITLVRMGTYAMGYEIRYRTLIARQVFPGNGPAPVNPIRLYESRPEDRAAERRAAEGGADPAKKKPLGIGEASGASGRETAVGAGKASEESGGRTQRGEG